MQAAQKIEAEFFAAQALRQKQCTCQRCTMIRQNRKTETEARQQQDMLDTLAQMHEPPRSRVGLAVCMLALGFVAGFALIKWFPGLIPAFP